MNDFTLGIDVSRWQDNISTPRRMDFKKSYEKGARFVFIKSSQGSRYGSYMDRDIHYNWKSAKEGGLLRGAYHFLTFDEEPRKQAEFMWSLIDDDPGELPLVADFETYNGITPPQNAYDILWNFCERIKTLSGRKPIIYTGAYFWSSYGSSATSWGDFPLWIASYTNQDFMEANVKKLMPSWKDWTFWQYTDKGDGIGFGAESKGLDMNYFNGNLEKLLQFAGVKPPVVIPPTPPVECNHDEVLKNLYSAKDSLQMAIDSLKK